MTIVLPLIAALLALPLVAQAGRPLAIDDAGSVDHQRFQLEAGVGYVHESDTRHFDFLFGLSYGLLPTLQVGFGFGSQLEERVEGASGRHTATGLGDLTLGVKWNPLSADRFWADHSLALTVKLPTSDEDRGFGSGKTDVDLTYIATKPLGEKFNVDFNLGYMWVGGEDPDVLHYGLAARWQAFDKVELVGEVFADTALSNGHETAVALNGGLRWEVWSDVVWDAAIGAGLNRHAPDWTATIGVTWMFGFGERNK
jgi:hypothetical protein